jgi:hypothetical protein
MPDEPGHRINPHAEPVSIAPSILRLSATQRIAAVGVVIAALWAAVFWAMS